MSDAYPDLFGARRSLETKAGKIDYFALPKLTEAGIGHLEKLPYSIKVLLESVLRNVDDYVVNQDDVTNLAAWNAANPANTELPFSPARVVLQDFTGVPAVVDLAALRASCAALGGDAGKINPLVPCDLVIDHSVMVDHFASDDAVDLNAKVEFQRNKERYAFLKWGQSAFDNFSVVPPDMGIVHQINLEYLAKGVLTRNGIAVPDSLVGTDSHTTMINGLGVVGWGVGGIEAEAVMLGQPIYMLTPKVVGFRLTGELTEGVTATDLVLTVTQMLREVGVVGQFVEFFGSGVSQLSLPNRATLANMAPEYGATMGFFPIDNATLDYLRLSGRDEETIDLVERYCKTQGLWRQENVDPEYTKVIELDISTVQPSLAGPKRPQDRVLLSEMKPKWHQALQDLASRDADKPASSPAILAGNSEDIKDGAVVVAAITSCTNTSNPSVLIAAGLLAQNAQAKGLKVKPWVKTSLAPGSRVVTEYLDAANLTGALESLGFHTVGYGCTTCIGNSGPLPEPVANAIKESNLVACSVLSGNRNFEGRISPLVRANYLASPPLVVAYAIAGTVNIQLDKDPLATDADGKPVYLKDIWPSNDDVEKILSQCVTPDQFRAKYSDVAEGSSDWQAIETSGGDLYEWDENSTYVQHAPFFQNLSLEPGEIQPISGARTLALLGDSVTTDHISPAGNIPADGPAGKYLISKGVDPVDFNSFGSRRGNHEVMMRGTFANIRIKNQLLPGTEGGITRYLPNNEQMSIYDAAMRYQQDGTPLVVLAGVEYGTGSSRDWAAKGTYLLGVRAVIAQSFERIHRSNLVGMGVLPLQFKEGESAASLGLSGEETFDINIDKDLKPQQDVTVIAKDGSGKETQFTAICRIDTPVEIEYYQNGGILQTVLRKIIKES